MVIMPFHWPNVAGTYLMAVHLFIKDTIAVSLYFLFKLDLATLPDSKHSALPCCCHSMLCMFKMEWQIITKVRTFSANFKLLPQPLKAIAKEAQAIFGTSRTYAFRRYPYCWGAIKTKRNGKYGYCFLNKDEAHKAH